MRGGVQGVEGGNGVEVVEEGETVLGASGSQSFSPTSIPLAEGVEGGDRAEVVVEGETVMAMWGISSWSGSR